MELMTQEQVKLVKQSWRIFMGIGAAIVGDLFYSKLFAENPSLKKMFPANMEGQHKKLVDMLSAIILRLDNMEKLTDDIAAMAQRHVGYAVRPAHYKLVGSALLWTLEKGLGKDWNEAMKAAWKTCYNILADTMIKVSSDNITL